MISLCMYLFKGVSKIVSISRDVLKTWAIEQNALDFRATLQGFFVTQVGY